SFEIEGVGALIEPAPAARLAYSPREEIERASRRVHGAGMMAAEGHDPDVVEIGATRGGRAVIGFYDLQPVIVIDSEQAGLGRGGRFEGHGGTGGIPAWRRGTPNSGSGR